MMNPVEKLTLKMEDDGFAKQSRIVRLKSDIKALNEKGTDLNF
ncbi:hypothetical protein VIN01S_29520 [Vibrio inusitatus NBRC 102082]|uniref:Uncharacterized protein n=1 Tax=Vibrio inusitatus NBRC 102082 TaxID=1219070 RepID=A0A4Y3HYQ1_9VIBR|nr:hypothetical protein [Vibrio inusitatus]GEA52148.1 hypothetical protein VIN01S_29520 [Vibrio inusitatus NBRC 102082]